jgi:hypothetical protein
MFLAAVGVAATLFGCSPDGVKPKDSKDGGIAGAAGDVHPVLDTVCKYSNTIFFRSDDGSFEINKCGYWEELAEPIACTEPQERWGSLQMYNGYIIGSSGNPNTHWLDVSFTTAYGWYCDFNAWKFVISNGITIDPNTGFPEETGGIDWSSAQYNPVRSEWQVQVLVNSLPQPCFDLTCKLSLVPIDVNGLPMEPYRTTVRAYNENWNLANSPESSNSPYAIHYCPLGCLEGPPPPPQDSTVTLGTCQGCESSNTVRFNEANSNCVDVTSCKNLSNVVVRDCNGTDYKFDGLRTKTGTFCHPSGLPISVVYVKSGCFQSGEGPGYGRRFDNPFDFCTVINN